MSLDATLLGAYAPLMLQGLLITAWTSAAAACIAVAAGLALALLLLARSSLLAAPARAYVEVMRGVPVLVVLFLLYYGGPSFGLVLDPLPAGILGLGLYSAAYMAEIFRGALRSVPPGQVESARMLGLRRGQILREVELPQTLAFVLPAGVNQLVVLVKESALLSIITVAELTKNATRMANETFAVVEPFLLVALLYWLLIEGLAQLGRGLERRRRWRP